MKRKVVSLLVSVVLLFSITMGVTLSAYAAGLPRFNWFDPLSNSYVIDEKANQFDFFETYDSVENLKAWANGKSSFLGANEKYDYDDLIDIYAKKIGIVDSNGKAYSNSVMSEYEKIAKIYQYMHITYTYDKTKGSSPEESFIVRTGYCETFSWVVNAFCKRAGIECWEIAGPSNHAWNVVKIDGKYYNIDIAMHQFLTAPGSHIPSWKTDNSEVFSANSDTYFNANTGSGTGVQQWIKKVGSSNLATSTYSKSTIDNSNNLTNPTLGLATPSVVNTTATSEGVIVKFKGVSNADWYEVWTAPIDGTATKVSDTYWSDEKHDIVTTNYTGNFVYYNSGHPLGYRHFDFSKVKTIHSIDKNESGQYQCFIENGDGNGIIVFIVAKNINGKCNIIPTNSTNVLSYDMDTVMSAIAKNYLPSCEINGTAGFTAAEVNKTNYAIYNANAKHEATNSSKHAYAKVKTIRAAGSGAQGADLYECKNCLQRQVKYTAASSLATPKISSISAENSGVQINWGKVSGAVKYRVFYKTGNGGWTWIADTTATSYTWAGAKNGTKYFYTVRCLSSDGKTYTSNYDSTGTSFTAYATPALSSVENAPKGVTIKWNAVSGAPKYRVFYRIGSGAWTKITDTTSTSYTWTGAKSGTKYTFTVRCLSSDAKVYTSGFNATGKTVTFLSAPCLTYIDADNSGTTIRWNKVSGAVKYRVFYKTASSGWTWIADTTATSYTWKNAKAGTKYNYTVRCISADGKTYTSSYNGSGLVFTAAATPKISSINASNAGTTITWGKAAGAVKYRVFCKTDSGGWTKIADTTSTSYTWKNAKAGTKYTYTVRCITADGKLYTSGFDSAGKAFTTAATPKISSVANVATGIRITWEKAPGAARYRVFYKTGNGGWTWIADTTGTSYTWTGGKKGTKYTFTVRCISADGKAYTSGYDTAGKSITK